jgi:hypothetical protein
MIAIHCCNQKAWFYFCQCARFLWPRNWDREREEELSVYSGPIGGYPLLLFQSTNQPALIERDKSKYK